MPPEGVREKREGERKGGKEEGRKEGRKKGGKEGGRKRNGVVACDSLGVH